jgi:hypothetical protein
MKRLISFISQQPLPNFIPINEPTTRPDVLHGVFTPDDARMAERWSNLKAVLANKFPQLELVDVPVADAYDAQAIQAECERLLGKYPNDEWALNATGGTKLMSAPAIEVFRRHGLDVYYVESPRNRLLKISPDWVVTPIAFSAAVDVETYFAIYGRRVAVGKPVSGQEAEVNRQLQELDWRVWPCVRLLHEKEVLAEYDAVGIRFYQCHVFECKRLSDWRADARDEILKDLHKLYQVQQHFGGPFGRSYWVFSGDHPLSNVNQERIRDFGIKLIRGAEINEIARNPEKFGLPQHKTKPVQLH